MWYKKKQKRMRFFVRYRFLSFAAHNDSRPTVWERIPGNAPTHNHPRSEGPPGAISRLQRINTHAFSLRKSFVTVVVQEKIEENEIFRQVLISMLRNV